MNRIFIDMDGVLVDFDAIKRALNKTGDEVKIIPGIYRQMHPFDGALEGAKNLMGARYDVFIATKPPTGYPEAYADKVSWVLQYLPELKRKIIITHDKGLLGDEGDILIDDRPHKANCEQFKGTLIKVLHPTQGGPNWPSILEQVKEIKRKQMEEAALKRMFGGQF